MILANYSRLSALRINSDFIHRLQSRHVRKRTEFIPKVLLAQVCKLSFGVVRCLHFSSAGKMSVVSLQFWDPKWHLASRASLAGDGSSSCFSVALVCLPLRISAASLKSEWTKPWVCSSALLTCWARRKRKPHKFTVSGLQRAPYSYILQQEQNGF